MTGRSVHVLYVPNVLVSALELTYDTQLHPRQNLKYNVYAAWYDINLHEQYTIVSVPNTRLSCTGYRI